MDTDAVPAQAQPPAARRAGKSGQTGLKSWIRALDAIKILDQRPAATLPLICNELAQSHGDRLALAGERAQLTYRELAEHANRYARWVLDQSIAPGETVCLLMPNCPEYVAIWLGLSQVGCVVALINTNLTGRALTHCITAAGAHHLIVAGSLLPAITAVAKHLSTTMNYWVHGDADNTSLPRIDRAIQNYAGSPPWISPAQQPAASDTAILIYTSGTTGLPKAAKVPHGRIVEWSYWFAGMLDIQPDDRLYNCLPMYHSTGGIVAIGSVLVRGASALIRERFSARRFWDDVIDGQCSLFIYIGELCRYLVRSPPHLREAEHKLRLCYGNGLQADIWQLFQDRFSIPKILEFYAATEGNVSLYNCEGKPGAIGHVPLVLADRFPVALIKCDAVSGEALRDAAGFCIRSLPGESGEAIGKISTTSHMPARRFDGYTDSSASARKILRNVFSEGDVWYRTGDLMRQDASGYYYFVDRLGDTFRWKGENVSSTEVAGIITACPGVTGAAVFGVAIPGHEGRAGMAALTIDGEFSFSTFQDHLATNVPVYARPIFVRICETLEMTATFKLKKTQLAAEGFAQVENADPIWIFDRAAGIFVPCDEVLAKSIIAGEHIDL